MLEPRFVICPACGGEGLWEVLTGGYDPRDGQADGYTKVCETCGGSGQIEESPEVRAFEDLDDDDPDPYAAFAYRGGNP
jgi:hypothetical protein